MPGQDSRSHWAISLFPAGMRSTRGKRKDEEGKRTKERREDQGGKKQSLNGGDLRGGTPGSETSKGVRAWALAAVGSGDHPRPERAGGKSAPRRPGKGGRSRSSQVLGLSAANAPPSRSLSSCPAHVERAKRRAEGWTRQPAQRRD